MIGLKHRNLIAVLLAVTSLAFLFVRLGHYSLWDDEALIALSAKGVLASGDTTAVIGHNLVAYRHGALLHDLHDRSTPPLPAYVTAASFGLFGESSFAARLPFALCGVLWIMLVLRWLKQSTDWKTPLLFSIAILGTVSLFLFFRQCRYYGIALFCSTAIVYLYVNWSGRIRELLWLALLGIALFAANYLNYVALLSCLLVDYVAWGRKRRRLAFKEWAVLLLPQLIVVLVVLSVWNPFTTANSAGISLTTFSLRVWLACVSIFDLSACEFGPGLLLLIAPFVALWFRDLWLLRASCAWLLYILVISLVSPQIMGEETLHADVRYLAPIIPFCIFIAVRVVIVLTRKMTWLALPLVLLAFGTNLFQGVTLRPFELHSTVVRYIEELTHPPMDPYKPTAEWIRKNIPARASVWVVPDHMTYPLMFHAPNPVYGWQLQATTSREFEGVDPILFYGKVAPDYVIVFGPKMELVKRELNKASAEPYQQVAALDVFWRDTYRPELYWREFKERTKFSRATEGVYVLRRSR